MRPSMMRATCRSFNAATASLDNGTSTPDIGWGLPPIGDLQALFNGSTDPVLLANLKSEAALLVANNLAPASRSTSIGSVASPAAMKLRQTPSFGGIAPTAKERPSLRYQGMFKPRKTLVQ